LETVVHRPMIAAAGGLLLLFLAAPLALWLAAPRTPPENQRAAAPRTAPPAGERVALISTKPSAPVNVPKPAAPPEALPLPARDNPPAQEEKQPEPVKPSEPRPVAAAPVPRPEALPPVDRADEAKVAAQPVAPSLSQRGQPWEHHLRYLLEREVRELDLDKVEGSSKQLLAAALEATPAPRSESDKDAKTDLPQRQLILDLLAQRSDLAGLPVRKGADCLAEAKTAKKMQEVSRDLRRFLFKLSPRQERDLSYSEVMARDDKLASLVSSQKGWFREETVSTLVQMLQAEGQPVRLQLIKSLSSVKGKKASVALAERALFDLSGEVREEAVKALKARPREEYRQVLLSGFRYPWAPVANHAAHALVALEDSEAAFSLAGLLDQPDPRAPVLGKDKKWVVSELVRVNHLRNCLLCHAPSSDQRDLVRGLVPTPGEKLPVEYYESRKGTFVRADIIYLRQDFSVFHPVAKAEPWPVFQRFDYMVRTRELTNEELAQFQTSLPMVSPKAATETPERKAPPSYPQREAVLFALRGLTGGDAGSATEDWLEFLLDAGLIPGS
jgi:hypothetical protein